MKQGGKQGSNEGNEEGKRTTERYQQTPRDYVNTAMTPTYTAPYSVGKSRLKGCMHSKVNALGQPSDFQ